MTVTYATVISKKVVYLKITAMDSSAFLKLKRTVDEAKIWYDSYNHTLRTKLGTKPSTLQRLLAQLYKLPVSEHEHVLRGRIKEFENGDVFDFTKETLSHPDYE